MQKARSRLQRPAAIAPTPALTRLRRPQKSAPKVSFAGIKKHTRFLPLLILAALCYTSVFLVVTRVQPEVIQNWLLPDSFLPFHLFLGLGNFFFFTFVTLRKRWGVFAALGIQWLLFLKLQGFTLDLWAWGSAALIGAGGYTAGNWWKKTKVRT